MKLLQSTVSGFVPWCFFFLFACFIVILYIMHANKVSTSYRFQLNYVEHDEDESNDNSTDKDQNDEKLNSQQFKDKSYGHIE